MATRSSKCKACAARTTSHTGFCQRCKSLRHHGYQRVKDEDLVVDQAGGAWWIWDDRGDVVVAGKPTKDAAIIALASGDVEENDVQASHATKRGPKRGPKPPFEVGDLVAATYRVPPFMSDDVLVVKELRNLGTKAKPSWRVRAASLGRRDVRRDPRGEPVEGWLDAEILERPPGWGRV